MKRLFDMVASGCGLLVLSPVLLLVAIWIKLDSRGPVFYRQVRVGYQNKDFRIFKFRSMRIGADKGSLVTIGGRDPRITRSGYFIRKYKLDELPQLINVFIGDMSLVGPRPERKEIVRKYEKEIPEFHYRMKVKAGLTGYAQVYGKYNTTPYDKLKLDMFYIENFSISLDIQLMFMTFRILFQKETSEGVESWQKDALKSSVDGDITKTEEKKNRGN